jgi:hypothetical protein
MLAALQHSGRVRTVTDGSPPKAQPPGIAQASQTAVAGCANVPVATLESPAHIAGAEGAGGSRERVSPNSQANGQRGESPGMAAIRGRDADDSYPSPGASMPLHTPLYDTHLACGAKLVDFGGWEMPLHYGSQVDEHHHVRKAAGMFDVSHMLNVDVAGPDATPFLRGYEDLLVRHCPDYLKVVHRNVNAEVLEQFFAPHGYEEVMLDNRQRFDWDGLVARHLSSSFVPRTGHEAGMAELRALFDAAQVAGQVEFEYDARIQFGRLS